MNRDEQITAWLDGAMSPDDARAFEAEMAKDSALAEAVEQATANDARLRAAFPEIAVDDALLAKLGLQAPEMPAADIVDFAAASRARAEPGPAANDNPRWRMPAFGALAAAVATILFVSTQSGGPGTVDPLQTALTELPSGASASLASGEVAQIRLSFRDKDGRACREFSVERGEAFKAGVACHTGKGWKIEAETRLAGNAVPNDSGYIPAGGDNPASLDDTYQRLGASDPLSAAEEKSMIAKAWKK